MGYDQILKWIDWYYTEYGPDEVAWGCKEKKGRGLWKSVNQKHKTSATWVLARGCFRAGLF